MSALLFFDIDGTLITLDEAHTFPESAKQALLKAKENGHKIFINTGRVKTAIDRHLKEFPFDGMVCGCGTYIEYEGECIFHKQIAKEKCVEYAGLLHELGYETLFEGRDRLYVDGDHKPGKFMQFIYDYFSKNVELPIGKYTDETLIFDKFTTGEKLACKKDEFRRAFEQDFHLIPHGEIVIEAVPIGYSKATGIQFLSDYLKVPIENCYAFGDSINDMEMLKYVPHSVGMGNAVDEVKQIVQFVSEDVLHDGIYHALKHYDLIENE